MDCHQARKLFDAYLDGELSPSLATELGAHRLRCPECRQAFALLEVSGHILRSDRDPVQAPDDFTDRLLACVDSAPLWRRKLLKVLYVGGPLAAAAVIALAFVGVFDRRNPSQVAGVQQIIAQPYVATSSKALEPSVASAPIDPAQQALNEFFDRSQQQVQVQGESVQRVFDLTILQMLEILEDAKNRSQAESRRPSFQPPYGPLPEQVESEGVDESISNEQDGIVEDGHEPESDPQGDN